MRKLVVGVVLAGLVVGVLLVTLLLSALASLVTSDVSQWCSPPAQAARLSQAHGGSSEKGICLPASGIAASVVHLAVQMAHHLFVNPACGRSRSFPACYYTWYDAGFPQAVLAYAQHICPGCSAWANGTFQCVSFVRGAYSQVYPMQWTNDAFLLWSTYHHKAGWMEVAATPQAQTPTIHLGLPLPGDVVVMKDLGAGHVGIVTAVLPPDAQGKREVIFANANSVSPFDQMTVSPDLVASAPRGWKSYVTWGYLRPAVQPLVGSRNLPQSPYVAVAQQDAAQVSINPEWFVRQINEESGFNPNALGPAVKDDNGTMVHAEGIAQFLPSVAARLGINPWDPVASLHAAAQMMADYQRQYDGDYAKALAAYNWGPGNLDHDLSTYGADWLTHVPRETRTYIHDILGW